MGTEFQDFMVWTDSQPNIPNPDRVELPELACPFNNGTKYLRQSTEHGEMLVCAHC